jgi:hypothetical protein
MTWREKIQPKEGDLRIRTKYLFLPMTIEKQTKWLERSTWVELYQRAAFDRLEWRPLSWRLLEDPAEGKGFWRTLYQRFFNQQTRRIL